MCIAKHYIRELDLSVSDDAYGAHLQTYRCQLIDNHHKYIYFTRFGKGLGLQSKVSAYYEALEHYTVHRFAQEMANNQDNYIVMYPYEYKLPCVSLMSIHDDETLHYPVYLLDPRYAKRKAIHDNMDYSNHTWRANDSGIASGTNLTEASIHALNELVERDAHSLFLIEAFIKNKNQQIKLIDKKTLPFNLQTIVTQIEQQYADDLMLFYISSDIDIPVMYASMTKQPFLIQPSGCGASLNAEYALERALLEALQPLHIHNEKLTDNQQQIISQLTPFPLLLNAAIADVTTLQNVCQTINFTTISTHHQRLTLMDQLQTIIKKIETNGWKIYKIPIIQHATGFTCIKYLIPGLEQFHLVQTGKRILPTPRGLELLKDGAIDNEKTRCLVKPSIRSLHGCRTA